MGRNSKLILCSPAMEKRALQGTDKTVLKDQLALNSYSHPATKTLTTESDSTSKANRESLVPESFVNPHFSSLISTSKLLGVAAAALILFHFVNLTRTEPPVAIGQAADSRLSFQYVVNAACNTYHICLPKEQRIMTSFTRNLYNSYFLLASTNRVMHRHVLHAVLYRVAGRPGWDAQLNCIGLQNRAEAELVYKGEFKKSKFATISRYTKLKARQPSLPETSRDHYSGERKWWGVTGRIISCERLSLSRPLFAYGAGDHDTREVLFSIAKTSKGYLSI
jgi:hypothetical protein